jgi:tetratricopeptide (TPR) repeat protein
VSGDQPVSVTGSDARSAAEVDDNARPHGQAAALEYIARGHAHSLEGDFAAAGDCFENALSLDPNLPMAQNNLGWVRERQGDRIGALVSYRRALELNGSLLLAQMNLASLLSEMGRTAEARPVWRALLAAHPGNRSLLDQVITVNLRTGDLAGASLLADEYAVLCYGSRWFPGSSNAPVPEEPFPAPLLSAGKLEHDIEQFAYLQERGLLPNGLADITDRYRTVLERIAPLGDDARLELNTAYRDLIGHVYSRIIYRRPAASRSDALSRAWRPRSAEDEYLGSPPGVVVLDDFLSEEALTGLRSYCLESTVWFKNSYAYGRLGAFFREGFNCPLLVQIAEELRRAFPRVIGSQPLLQMWGFKYGYFQPETLPHADFAAVNVNFWITPDEANRKSDSGGMIVYDVEAPESWDFDTYNRRGDKIAEFLSARKTHLITIPYRSNRAIIFNSDLFHATSPIQFGEGYHNRRINITMLYGRRSSRIDDSA